MDNINDDYDYDYISGVSEDNDSDYEISDDLDDHNYGEEFEVTLGNGEKKKLNDVLQNGAKVKTLALELEKQRKFVADVKLTKLPECREALKRAQFEHEWQIDNANRALKSLTDLTNAERVQYRQNILDSTRTLREIKKQVKGIEAFDVKLSKEKFTKHRQKTLNELKVIMPDLDSSALAAIRDYGEQIGISKEILNNKANAKFLKVLEISDKYEKETALEAKRSANRKKNKMFEKFAKKHGITKGITKAKNPKAKPKKVDFSNISFDDLED